MAGGCCVTDETDHSENARGVCHFKVGESAECRSADVANMRSEHVVDEDLDVRVNVAHVAGNDHCHTPFALT